MRLAMIGLGTMGGKMAQRLLEGGHHVVGFDPSAEALERHERQGGSSAGSPAEVVEALERPRCIWLMVPAGKIVDNTIQQLTPLLAEDDIIIDGGNSDYRDTQRRGRELGKRGLHFVDVGTSGGVWGLEQGYSMMVGGDTKAVDRLRPVLETLAPGADRGWGHVGPAGAGHYVKMIHNGIEYGMMQAYAEGFALLKAKRDFNLDLRQVSEIWRFGSVIRSWLLDLTAEALEESGDLKGIAGWVQDSGEGRWTVRESIDLAVPAPVITLALQQRFRSRIDDAFADKLLAAMRNKFGGHSIKAEEP